MVEVGNMAINSRTKGNSFEIRVSKLVVKAFEHKGITQKDCYRTPSSGGHKYAKQEDPGDLVISKKLRKYFPFHVEAKHWRRVELWPLWFPEDKQLNAWKFKLWLNQAVKASKKTKQHPLIVFKGNGKMPVMCMYTFHAMDTMGKAYNLPFHRLRIRYKGKIWFISKFDDFLRTLCQEK